MSTTGKEYKLAIRIAGVIDKSFGVSLATANSTLKKNVAAINSDFTKLDKGFDSIMKTGQKCFSAIATAAGVAATAIAAASVASVAVGSEFESAFAGVKKTVDATEQEYARLREEIIAMSGEIPSSAAEIAAVMEIAGQLGIATDSLSDFTKTMINLGVSTNLEATEAADALARFANVTNMANYDENGISNYERLGSVVVDLGNNFATTEEEIVAMATNLAATGDMVGLSQAQIMALATAMSATGIRAEKGGSAMSKLLKNMQIATESGGDSLEQYAHVANMTGEQFKETFQKDAVVALAAFLEGLNDTDRLGQSAILTLKDMKLSEVRLSDVILRLANAEGDLSDAAVEAAIADELFSSEAVDASYSASLLGDAIELANRAWDENTALAIEAGKRYETAESQLKLMGNAFTNLGIAAYDGLLREPYVDTISNITDAVNNFTKNDLQGWLNKISTSLPTVQRKAKNTWKTVSPFLNGMLNFGKWMVKNGDYIISALIGIGAALATYKVASEITHFVNAILSLTTGQWVILGVVAAIGALVGAISAYKAYRQNLVDESLAKHFGSISLSMGEIQRIAEEIVRTDSLGAVREALSAFDNADGVLSSLQTYIDELNLMNWKVSVGLELNEEEKEAYQTAVTSYIAEIQDYVAKESYAVQLNVAATFGEDSEIGSKINAFYLATYNEMDELGKNFANAVNEAFSDEVLDPQKIEKLADAQRKMAELQAKLATGDFEAGLIELEMKYGSGVALDADSFQNLQDELAKQVESVSESYLKSYSRAAASAKNSYDAGYLTDAEYQQAITEAELAYYNNMTESLSNAAAFQIQTIQDAYGKEISSAIESTLASYEENGLYDWLDRPGILFMGMRDNLYKNKDFRTTRDSIEQRLEAMQPTIEQMRDLESRYEALGQALGQEVPEGIAKALERIDMWEGLVDLDMGDGFWKAIGEQIANGDHSEFYNEVFKALEAQEKEYEGYGYDAYEAVPQGLYDGIDLSAQQAAAKIEEQTIRPVVEGMYAWSQEAIDEYYSKGFDVDADLRINLNPIYNGLPAAGLSREMSRWGLPNLPGIDRNADGGIIQNKELSWIAENGPESIIPLDGSKNAISLWEKTGKLLGMESVLDRYKIDGGDNNYSIEYSPTFQFYGEAPSKEDMVDAARISQEEFDQRMDQYFKTHRRVSFG